jgi:hypothetical protein
MSAARCARVGALPALLLAAAGCHPSDLDPMKRQARARAYQPSARFFDGRAMRTPPAGTVPRERVLGDPRVSDGSDEDGAPVTQIPLRVTAPLLQRGRARFDVVCAPCHGLVGDGQSAVARKMSLRPPPSLLDERIRRQPPGALFRTLTLGFGLMPAHASALPVYDRWAVVAYLGALQLSQRAPLALAPSGVRARLEEVAP